MTMALKAVLALLVLCCLVRKAQPKCPADCNKPCKRLEAFYRHSKCGTCEADFRCFRVEHEMREFNCLSACNTAAGDRCLPKAFNCTTSSGTCGDGEQCCIAPTGQCNEEGIKIQCVPPDVCISLPGGNVHADLTCHDSPADDVCCYITF